MPELEEAEHAVLQAFEGALEEPIEPMARTVVAEKLEVIKATHQRIAALARRAA